MMCSDGVWDLINLSKAVKMCRMKTADGATGAVMSAVSRDMRLLDDASIIVVDFLPSEATSFPTVALKVGRGAVRVWVWGSEGVYVNAT